MRSEGGSVTIVVAAGFLVVAVLALGATDVGRVLDASERAQTAADAAALAAAAELAWPTGADPGALAMDYAQRNGATIVSCRCALGSLGVQVTVRRDVGALLLVPGDHDVQASAAADVGVIDP
jgi:DNA topoisomerase-1